MDVLGRFLDPAANPGLGSTADQSPSFPNSYRHANLLDEEISLTSSRPKKPAGQVVFKETHHPVYRVSGNGATASGCASSASRRRSPGYGSGRTLPLRWRHGHTTWPCWHSEGGMRASTSPTRHGGSVRRPLGIRWIYRGRRQRRRGHTTGRRCERRRPRAAAEAARAYDREAVRKEEAKGGGEVNEKDSANAVDGSDVVMNSLSSPESTFFMEAEVAFGSDLDCLEQWMNGPLLSPPREAEMFHPNWEEVENDPTEMCLWSYSI